jgi:hypothetical protein
MALRDNLESIGMRQTLSKWPSGLALGLSADKRSLDIYGELLSILESM